MNTTNKENAPKISVIIPIKHEDDSLEKSLTCILNQTLSNIEIICITNSSDENSSDILNIFAEQDSRIRIFSQAYQNASKARNLALYNATGEYVSFIDPGDYFFDENSLELLYNTAKENNCVIAGGGFSRISENSAKGNISSDIFCCKEFDSAGICDSKEYQTNFGFHRFIFNRNFLNSNDITFSATNTDLGSSFLIKALQTAQKFYAVRETIYCYNAQYIEPDWYNCYNIVDFINDCYEEFSLSKKYELKELQTLLINNFFDKKNIDLILKNCNIDVVKQHAEKLFNLLKTINKDIVLEKIYGTDLDSSENMMKQDYSEINFDKNEIKVSVIVPVYNVEEYLRPCLDSLINQTLKNIEIICINDCSPDNSASIMEEYASRDSRIKNIHLTENGGLSNARNVALEHVKGKYIIFIDSDDILKHEALEDLYNIAETNNTDQILFLYEPLFEGDYKNVEAYYYREFPNALTERIYKGTYIFERLLDTNSFFVSACIKFTKTSLLKEHNITFLKGYIHEDNHFSAKTIVLSDRVIAINKRYYIRRLRDNSIMTSCDLKANIRHVCGYVATLGTLLSEIKSNVFSEDQLKAIKYFCTRLSYTITSHCIKIPPYDLNIIFKQLKSCPGNENWEFIIPSLSFIYNLKETARSNLNKKLLASEKKYKEKINSQKNELTKAKKKNKRLEAKVNSLTYKVGLFVTFIPRKCYDLFIKILGVFNPKK